MNGISAYGTPSITNVVEDYAAVQQLHLIAITLSIVR